jgi:enediyne biosynthesis protein E3
MNEELDMRLGPAPAPPTSSRRLWGRLLGWAGALSPAETKVVRRGFSVGDPAVVTRLEAIGAHFVDGFNCAIGACDLGELASVLASRERDNAGFIYEGAAMGVAIADFLTPGRRLFEPYIAGPAAAHEYMAWVGLGWALARLPVAPERFLARYSNLNCWLALDGYGFHEGYFHWPKRITGQRRPRLSADGQHVFDQGLGRSLWFVMGAEPHRVAACIAAFSAGRHADLWAGVGLAAAYAGVAKHGDYSVLLAVGAAHACSLAQGVVFAAEARRRAGNPVAHLEQACQRILGLDAGSAAAIALASITEAGTSLASYQQWRFTIQRRCAIAAPHLNQRSMGAA